MTFFTNRFYNQETVSSRTSTLANSQASGVPLLSPALSKVEVKPWINIDASFLPWSVFISSSAVLTLPFSPWSQTRPWYYWCFSSSCRWCPSAPSWLWRCRRLLRHRQHWLFTFPMSSQPATVQSNAMSAQKWDSRSWEWDFQKHNAYISIIHQVKIGNPIGRWSHDYVYEKTTVEPLWHMLVPQTSKS